jgi:hypothetical protein
LLVAYICQICGAPRALPAGRLDARNVTAITQRSTKGYIELRCSPFSMGERCLVIM